MSTPNPAPIYQLRIRLDRISPLIWRRLLVTDATTIAELHAIIQIAFGRSDSLLHRFVIHGKRYGIAYLGGISFDDDPDHLRLADFRFRAGECFTYEYNFHVPWRHQIRVEQILSPAPGHHYPHLRSSYCRSCRRRLRAARCASACSSISAKAGA